MNSEPDAPRAAVANSGASTARSPPPRSSRPHHQRQRNRDATATPEGYASRRFSTASGIGQNRWHQYIKYYWCHALGRRSNAVFMRVSDRPNSSYAGKCCTTSSATFDGTSVNRMLPHFDGRSVKHPGKAGFRAKTDAKKRSGAESAPRSRSGRSGHLLITIAGFCRGPRRCRKGRPLVLLVSLTFLALCAYTHTSAH